MKTQLFTSLTALVFGTAALADMHRETVHTIPSEAGSFIGTLAQPSGDPAPVVLLLHGFTGSRNELPTEHVSEGIFARTAARLAESGYASLRIDFRGSGESMADMSFAETTFETQIADAQAAMAWLQSHEGVDGEDIFVIGWSQGGLVATGAAGRTNLPDAVALWAAVATPQDTYGGLLGAEVMAAGAAAADDAPVTATLPWGAEIQLNGAFFDGIASYDPMAEIARYSGPLLVAQGADDTAVPAVSAQMLIDAHEGPEEMWLAQMDHTFNAFVEDETLERMIALTIGFFDAHAD